MQFNTLIFIFAFGGSVSAVLAYIVYHGNIRLRFDEASRSTMFESENVSNGKATEMLVITRDMELNVSKVDNYKGLERLENDATLINQLNMKDISEGPSYQGSRDIVFERKVAASTQGIYGEGASSDVPATENAEKTGNMALSTTLQNLKQELTDVGIIAIVSTESAYCLKCRKKNAIASIEHIVTKNGRKALKGNCSVCGSRVFRIIKS